MDFRVPELGEGVYEAELLSWLVKPGDVVRRGQGLMEVMTDKATMEVPSPFAGTIDSVHGEVGDEIQVGQVILTYTPAGPAEPKEGNGKSDAVPAAPRPAEAPAAAPVLATPERVKAAPSVRHLARKLGVDLTRITGSGPAGRILLEDLAPHLRREPAPAARAEPPAYGTPGTRLKLQGLRRRIADHMVQSKRTIPHYSYVDECDVTELVKLRAALRERFQAAGVKLTYLAFVVKAVTAALKAVPLVNASLDEAAGEIVLHDRYHVGVAVATPAGLVVPVIHDADRLDLARIAREIERLSDAARAGTARREELRGSTFTVTSVGNIGGLFSTPVINHPEVGILGLGKVVRRPVFDAAGQVRPADLVYLSLSFDHRVVDGAVGAAFTNVVREHLQNPAGLLLPEKLL